MIVRPIPRDDLQLAVDLWHINQQGFLVSFDGNDKLAATIANLRSADSLGTYELTNFKSSSTANDQTLFASCDTATTTSFLHIYVALTTGRVTISAQNAAGTVNTVSGTLNVCDGIRHYIQVKSSGTAWSIVVDGVIDTPIVVAGSNTGDWFADITLRDNVTHGVKTTTGDGSWAIAEMAQHRLYSRELSDAECKANYQKGWKAEPSDATGRVYNLPCTEGTGNPVETVAAVNPTMTGATWVEGLIDRSTNALALTSFGSPVWSNQGRTLNGTTQYLTTPHSSALDFERTDKFALAAWVKTASAGNGNSILSKQLNSGNYNGYTMELANSGKLYMNLINDVSPSQYTSVSSTNSVNDDEWHFILAQNKALAGGAGSDIEIFIDAVQETPVIAVDTLGSNSILTTTSLDIGARTGGQLIAATIGEVWVYSGTFSLPGVIQLRNATRWRYV